MKDFNLDIPKTGYIVAVKISKNDIIFGKLIKNAQQKYGLPKEDCEYTHVMMSMGGNDVINASFPFIKTSRLTRSYARRYIKIIKPRIMGYELHRKNVAVHCASRRGRPYGFLGLFWFLKKKWFGTNIFSFFGDFCSEVCGLGLYLEYIEKLGFKEEQVMPRHFSKLYPADFLNPMYFEVVWEGYIS